MDEHAFGQWLKETGLSVVPPQVAPADGELLSEDRAETPPLSLVAELDLADPEEDDEDTGAFADLGKPGDRLENTELVAAAFRAAGNPKYQDVTFKSARVAHRPVPTYREIALERAKRVNRSVAAW
jgi:hypothetical protein